MTEGIVDAPEGSSPRRWGLGDALGGWVLSNLLAIVALWVVQAATGRDAAEMDDLSIWLSLPAQLALWAGLLGVPLLVTRLKGAGPVRDLRLGARLADARFLVVGGVLQVALVPLYWPLLQVFDKSNQDLEEPARDLLDRVHGPAAVVLILLWVGVIAPVVEEIFYRGLLLRALRKRGLAPWPAILVSGVMFGAIHFQLLQLPALAIVGVVTSWYALRYDRLGPAIAVHMGFNLVSVITLLTSR